MADDITAEFAEWAKKNNHEVPDEDEESYDDLWEQFLDEEYNRQRTHPEEFR